MRRALPFLVLIAACTTSPAKPVKVAEFPDIDATAALRDITRLSSDEFEGRLPGTKGEQLTVQYLTEQFKAIGLEPGNPDGTYVQRVPLVGMTPSPAPLSVTRA